MKTVFLIVFLFLCQCVTAQNIPKNLNFTDKDSKRQGKWTILFDKDFKPIEKAAQVSYYRLIEYKDDKPTGTVTDYYLNGKKQFEGQMIADRPEEVMDGNCIWYQENGNKSQQATFNEGQILGEIKEYNSNGTLNSEGWNTLTEQGMQLYRAGKYEEALPLWERAKVLVEKEFSKENKTYAMSLNNLALIYFFTGNHAKAEAMYLEVKEIYVKYLDKYDPDYAQSLSNLALLYSEQGKYAKAETLFLEALKIKEKTLGKEHLDYIQSLNNLALMYNDQGNYAKAENLLLNVKGVYSRILGKEHPDYATSLNNLAEIYSSEGNYTKAEPLYLEASKIIRNTLGKDHPHYTASLNNLASLYYSERNYEKAHILYLDALKFGEKSLGKEHPDYANSLNNLAALYYTEGNYAKAEPLFVEALRVRDKSLGKDHPNYASSLNNLGLLYECQDNYQKAEPLFVKSHQVYFRLLETQFALLSEKEKEAFLMTFKQYFETFNSFVLKRKMQNPTIVGNMYNNLLATKALLFNAQNRIRNNIIASGNKDLISLYQNWQAKRQNLAKVYQMPLAEKEKIGIDVPKIEEEANELEKQLSSQSQAFAQANDNKSCTWRDIQKRLKPDQAAIEMVRFTWYNKKWTDTVYYAALIITPSSNQPDLVLLKNGKELEGVSIAYYKNTILKNIEDKNSYKQFWAPIAERLKIIAPHTIKIYFSPDGVYNSININTLLNPLIAKFVSEEIDIQLVTTSKDLVTIKRKNNPSKDASLFGYPDYSNKNTDTTRSFNFNYKIVKTDSLKRDFEDGIIPMLPGTEKEINNIEKLLIKNYWKTGKFTLGLASENKIKALINPCILHIATHGFFMTDLENLGQENGFAGFNKIKFTENPLLRSGLLLSGSQQAYDGKADPDKEDGILTAYEAMNLNLENTELVVLSACETGRGEIKNGEGVYGLQRAFQIAGARTVMMSLWKVDDNATQEFMTDFYEHWLKSGNKREAFIHARQTIKAKYIFPYYWGAFVMVGE